MISSEEEKMQWEILAARVSWDRRREMVQRRQDLYLRQRPQEHD